MSLHERPGERPVSQRRIQTQMLGAVDQRVLKPLQQKPKGQDRTRQQRLELDIR